MSPNLDYVIRQLRSLNQDFEDNWSPVFYISADSLSITYLNIITCFKFIAILELKKRVLIFLNLIWPVKSFSIQYSVMGMMKQSWSNVADYDSKEKYTLDILKF